LLEQQLVNSPEVESKETGGQEIFQVPAGRVDKKLLQINIPLTGVTELPSSHQE
jgi:hypothetical protein